MIHLHGAYSSIVFDHDGDTLQVIHWGIRLGAVNDDELRAAVKNPHFHGGLDVSPRNLILREHSRGWIGHPALRGHRSGVSVSNWFVLKSATQKDNSLVATFEDPIAKIAISLTYTMTPSDVLLIDATVTNIGEGEYFLEHFKYWLPLPDQADQVMDFFGHWTKERQPQRRDIGYGLTTREGFEGR